MPTVSKGLFRWLFYNGARLEDFADRLNHVWTFGLLLILGAVISWKHNYSEPISCWTPSSFPVSNVRNVHQTCWHSYYIRYPTKEYLGTKLTYQGGPGIPLIINEVSSEEDKLQWNTTYYQWIPLILCLQALLFKLPNVILYIFHSFSGLDFDKVAGLTAGYQCLNLAERQTLANQIARYIYRWCKMFPRGLPWKLLTVFWFLAKLLYCINIIIQMTFFDRFLTTENEPFDNSTSYGDAIIDNIAKNNGSFWKVSPPFPRKVLCEFNVRMLTSVQKFTVQCDLNANPFTEHALMFLWVWLLFVAVVTTLSFVVWILLTLLPFPRQRYIKRLVELADESHEGKSTLASNLDVSLVTGLVGEDGVMVLKLIGANSSELLVSDVVCGIVRMVGREGPMLTSGTVVQPASVTQPLMQPSAPNEIYPVQQLATAKG